MDDFDLREWSGFVAAGGDPAKPAIINQIVIDSRRIDSPPALFVALKGEHLDGHDFLSHAQAKGAYYALVSNKASIQETSSMLLLMVEDPLTAFQEICSCYRKAKNTPILAITGSYGKTMLKDLLFCLLKETKNVIASPESFNSQIGVPLSLLQISSKHELAIIEAGISKPGEMDSLGRIVSPAYSILTNVRCVHLTSLGSQSMIASEKIKLLEYVPENGWVIAPSDSVTTPHLSRIKAKCYLWDQLDPALPYAEILSTLSIQSTPCRVIFPDGRIEFFSIPYEMPYLIQLINIAIQAAWLLGLDSQEIYHGLQNYIPEPMQTEIWTSPLGATFINGAYSADPVSVALALKNLQQVPPAGKKIFIFGGIREQTEGNSYLQIARVIADAKVDKLLLINLVPSVIKEISKHSPMTEVIDCKDISQALREIRHGLKKEDIVLIQGPKKQSLNDLANELNELIGGNRLLINLSTIQTNIESLRAFLPSKTRIMAMVKAQAYGTDHIILSRFLQRCKIDILGLAHIDEAISLKRAGIQQHLFVINCPLYEVHKLVKWNLQVGVSNEDLIAAIEQEAEKQKTIIHVHLHIDTGMSRFGCRPEEALYLAKRISQSPSLKLEGIMTHFACAEMVSEDAFTTAQITSFRKVIAFLESHGIYPPWRHASNSSGALRSFFPEGNMVRIGLSIFGLQASSATGDCLELDCATTLTSRISGINHCKKGESISYGRKYQVQEEDAWIGVIPLGYFDGFHRHYSGKGYVLIHGKQAPLVGAICMDYFMVDLTEIPHAKVGDPVLIFGKDPFGHSIPPEEFAARVDTNVHELVTCLGPRIQRIFIQNEH
jgi:alanine racemase/UDP-N-acetylmuramoyl-tripeptide--D-alanyl-D-alanine ligase